MRSNSTLYKSYSFVDKDPVIDKLRTIIKDEGATDGEIAEASGVSPTTLWNWFRGDTKRPQFATVMAVARSLGYDLQIVRANRRAHAGVTLRKQSFRAVNRDGSGQREAHHA